MNTRRWLSAGVAAFVVISLLDYVAHGNLLMGLYRQTASVWRAEEGHSKAWLMYSGTFIFSMLFALIYAKGYESGKAGLGQGLRYGILIGLLYSIPHLTIWYVVLPIPLALAAGWVASSFIDCVTAGMVVGLLYRP